MKKFLYVSLLLVSILVAGIAENLTWDGMMPGVSYEKNDAGDRFVNGIFGIVVGKALTERLRTFAELSLPKIASSKNGGTQASFNTGVAYLINDNCQVDAALSKGLNHRTADLGVTIGLSFKL